MSDEIKENVEVQENTEQAQPQQQQQNNQTQPTQETTITLIDVMSKITGLGNQLTEQFAAMHADFDAKMRAYLANEKKEPVKEPVVKDTWMN